MFSILKHGTFAFRKFIEYFLITALFISKTYCLIIELIKNKSENILPEMYDYSLFFLFIVLSVLIIDACVSVLYRYHQV